jgi:predicted patatin/cPLA2 family phospholipase
MKLGLVLEGGAHRTIFSCGVMDAFLDAGIYADYVIGASAGITYGVSYVSRQKERNRNMLGTFVQKPQYMGMRHLLNPFNRSYYNLKYVFDTIPNKLLPFDYDAYRTYHGEVLACVTNMQMGRAEYLPVEADDPQWHVLQATCALPLMFKPIKLDGVKYADGGVADSIPYAKALSDGCDKVIIILTRERSYRKEEEKAQKYAANQYRHRFPAYADLILSRHERYNESIEEIAKLEASGRVYVIAPEDTLGVGRTERDTDKLLALYAQGYAIAMQQRPALERYIAE